ncbi:hypothetical protein C8R44DRAFT_637739 [Mycena epipterygia]|nr:hypothetical protein C8R44DRAFT_637739 [Mycena epipterygia]
MVDRVVKCVKGAQLGSAERYGVYEVEGVSKVLAMKCLREESEEVIPQILSLGLDNRVAITTTTSAKPGPGHYICNTFHRRLCKARETHNYFRLHVDWTPGHIDIPGNEAADEAAKQVAWMAVLEVLLGY